MGMCVFFLKQTRLYLTCYTCQKQWHWINWCQPRFTVEIFTSIVIHGMDLFPSRSNSELLIYTQSCASGVFCCLAFSLPSNFGFAQTSLTWEREHRIDFAGTRWALRLPVCRCGRCARVCRDRRLRRMASAPGPRVTCSASLVRKMEFSGSDRQWNDPNRKVFVKEKITWEC